MVIAFDLDGTLVDSSRDLAESANALLETYAAPALPSERILSMVGNGAPALVERACRAAGLEEVPGDAIPRFLAIYHGRLLRHTRPYPGIEEALTHLGAQHTLTVLTNKPAAASLAILDGTGLRRHFAAVVGGDGPWPRKPDPAGLRSFASLARGARTLLVGDSRVDRATAEAAPASFCLARYGFGCEAVARAGDPPGIDRPSDLPALVAALEEAPR